MSTRGVHTIKPHSLVNSSQSGFHSRFFFNRLKPPAASPLHPPMNWMRTRWTIAVAVAVVALAMPPQQGGVQLVSAKSYVFGTIDSNNNKPTPAPTTAGGDDDYGEEPAPTPAATTLNDDYGEEEPTKAPTKAPAPTPAATTPDDDYGEEQPTKAPTKAPAPTPAATTPDDDYGEEPVEVPAPTPSKTPCKKLKNATEKKPTAANNGGGKQTKVPVPQPEATTLDNDYGEDEPTKAPAPTPVPTTPTDDYGEGEPTEAPAPTPSKTPCKKLKNATEKPKATPVQHHAKPESKAPVTPALITREGDYGEQPAPMTPAPTPSKTPCKYPLKKETQAPVKPTPQPTKLDEESYGEPTPAPTKLGGGDYGDDIDSAPVDVPPMIDDSYDTPVDDGYGEAPLPARDDSYGEPPAAEVDDSYGPASVFPSPTPSKTPCPKNKTTIAPTTVVKGDEHRVAKGGSTLHPVVLTNTSKPAVTLGVQSEETDEVFDNIHEGECAGKITTHDNKELAKNCAKTFEIMVNGKTLHTCVNCPSGFTEEGAYPYFKCGDKPLCSRFLSFTNIRPDDLLCAVKNNGKDDLMTACDFEG